MKLTKQKLEQLITEEYKSMSRRIFDKRRKQAQGPGVVRIAGDADQPINYPEYADKLSRLAKQDPAQAEELATALGEPLDVNVDTSNSETFKIPDVPDDYFDTGGPFFAHALFVSWANKNGYPEMGFANKIDDELVKQYTIDKGLPYERELRKIKHNSSRVMGAAIRRSQFNPEKEMTRVHDVLDPFGHDPHEED